MGGLDLKTTALDPFRLLAAFLVVANHTSPLLSLSGAGDFILTHIISRVAVPFFLMVSGYFLYKYTEKGDNAYIKGFLKKIGLLYIGSMLLFLPLNIYAGHYQGENWLIDVVKDVLFNGTFYHLWYLPGLITGSVLVLFLIRWLGLQGTFFVSIFLYLIGLFGDSYYGLAKQLPLLEELYESIFSVSEYTRNGFFMVPIFLVMGMLIANRTKKIKPMNNFGLLLISLAFLIVEGLLLHHYSLQRHDSMYIMLIPTMYFLFLFLLKLKGKSSKRIRNLSLLIYIIHPWLIVLVRFAARLLHLEKLLIHQSFMHYLAVSGLSLVVAWVLVYVGERFKSIKDFPSSTYRAWAEIDLDALRHNTKTIQRNLPRKTGLMAVVKADAYGHGAVPVAKVLNGEGVQSFAVATLVEGIQLRKSGIKGEILILGYTDPEEIGLIKKYQLTQTVVDSFHARELNKQGKKIKVHLKMDTGMHRLGVDPFQHSELKGIFACLNLKFMGVFSHLSVSDSLKDEDMIYSKHQIECFNESLARLEQLGHPPEKRHIQASYGILNFPDLQYDYARAGIILYGVLSKNERVATKLDLKPVLSVKARIATVKTIQPGECVSYGRLFTAKDRKKIATVTIGYGDGLPRNLIGGYVLIHSQKAPIIGRICMDQLMVDVTHIDTVHPSDVVTIIGRDGKEQISCEEFAEKAGTITNEVLSRLGPRLHYVYKN